MKNKKVLWAILAVIVIAAAYTLIAKPFTPKGDGSITVKVTDIDQKLIKEKKIVFKTGDKLTDLVKNSSSRSGPTASWPRSGSRRCRMPTATYSNSA